MNRRLRRSDAAWWRDSGTSLTTLRADIDRMAVDPEIPLAFAAHQGSLYAGSVLLVSNDLAERPQYVPWIAALWVEPGFRCRGVAQDLVQAARSEARRLGHAECYLGATDANSPYYLARGFRMIESGVAGLNVFAT